MKHLFYLLLCLTTVLFSCKDDEVALPDNVINFETATQGIDSDESSKTITVNLSRAAEKLTTVTLQLTTDGVFLGNDFTISPEPQNGIITLTIPKDSTSASFSVTKAEDLFLGGEEFISFLITSVSAPALLGSTLELTVSFSSIVSAGASMTLNGGEGGSSAVNSVFIDFSNNTQTSISRSSWDLGFYCGSDFRVILNNTTSACAVVTDKTDITTVGSADTVGVTLSLSTTSSAMALIDDVTGDITKTVITSISANEAENKVYIINRGTGGGIAKRDLVKIRILQSDGGYSLQYAGLNETVFKTISISKDNTKNFEYISFDNGMVSCEPLKLKWDIEWTGAIYKTTYGGSEVPYYFADQVYINHVADVSAAEILTSVVSYDGFSETNSDTLAFIAARNVIGANWRVTSGGTVGVKTDRFYVIKDAAGNIYKLKFLNFTSADGGTRGYPNIEYRLVKKGN